MALGPLTPKVAIEFNLAAAKARQYEVDTGLQCQVRLELSRAGEMQIVYDITDRKCSPCRPLSVLTLPNAKS